MNQLKGKCREYNIPLCVAFVDYEKVFDSVHTQAILTSLQEQGIEGVYIMKDIYTDSSVTVHLHKESETIRIKRGVRQGTPSHPSCSRQHCMESVFRSLNLENKGVKIEEEFLNILRFAVDIFYAKEHYNNYNICYKKYPMKVKDKCDDCRQHPNQREQCADRKC